MRCRCKNAQKRGTWGVQSKNCTLVNLTALSGVSDVLLKEEVQHACLILTETGTLMNSGTSTNPMTTSVVGCESRTNLNRQIILINLIFKKQKEVWKNSFHLQSGLLTEPLLSWLVVKTGYFYCVIHFTEICKIYHEVICSWSDQLTDLSESVQVSSTSKIVTYYCFSFLINKYMEKIHFYIS